MNRFNLTEWAIRHRSLVIYFMLVIVAAGIGSYLRLGRSEDPDFTVKTMVVQVGWPGATVSDTLEQITDRLERKLEETPNLDYLKSYTTAGQATVFVNLKDSTPAAKVPDIWYQVRKKVYDIRNTCRKASSALASTTSSATPTASSTALPPMGSRIASSGTMSTSSQAAPRAAGHLEDRRARRPGRARRCGVLDRAARRPRDRPRRADRRLERPERRHASGRGADRRRKDPGPRLRAFRSEQDILAVNFVANGRIIPLRDIAG